MRRRTLRPSSRQALVVITMALALVVWVSWEVGRLPWLRLLGLTGSVAVFSFFAVGWLGREG